MIYEALFVICAISPINTWAGDIDSGPTCVIAEKAEFATIDQCEFRLRETLAQVRKAEEQRVLATRIPGPYSYDMSCKATIEVGVLNCLDCPTISN